MSRRNKLVLFSFALCLLALLLMLSSAQEVYANLTQKLCDSNVKYYCSQVDYGTSGSGWQINGRRYWGGYDINTPGGTRGADKWQLWLLRDWQAPSGT